MGTNGPLLIDGIIMCDYLMHHPDGRISNCDKFGNGFFIDVHEKKV